MFYLVFTFHFGGIFSKLTSLSQFALHIPSAAAIQGWSHICIYSHCYKNIKLQPYIIFSPLSTALILCCSSEQQWPQCSLCLHLLLPASDLFTPPSGTGRIKGHFTLGLHKFTIQDSYSTASGWKWRSPSQSDCRKPFWCSLGKRAPYSKTHKWRADSAVCPGTAATERHLKGIFCYKNKDMAAVFQKLITLQKGLCVFRG